MERLGARFAFCCCQNDPVDDGSANVQPITDMAAVTGEEMGAMDVNDPSKFPLSKDGAGNAPELAQALEKTFFVILKKEKPGDQIGLDILPCDSARYGKPCLKVCEVKEGLVRTWNRSQPEKEVLACDLIIEVNGAENSCQGLLARINYDKDIVMKVTRPP
mmetsp:Transcript_26302/g.74303  ORF Transcript_26302/g.74303 Transcript_26302/m.74303 type:complete len:161 (-) Transcript_26302:179-661(-)